MDEDDAADAGRGSGEGLVEDGGHAEGGDGQDGEGD